MVPNGYIVPSLEVKKRAREQAKQADETELAVLGETYVSGENSLAKLSRYEATLQRNLMRALHELQRLQAARKGEHVPAPVAVDVDVAGLPNA
jgi:hypothetical protein